MGRQGYSPAPYMTANMMEDTHDTSLVLALNTTSISLLNTEIDLPTAQEKPMEMNAPTTTAHPPPPFGGERGSGVNSTGPSFDDAIVSNEEFQKCSSNI